MTTARKRRMTIVGLIAFAVTVVWLGNVLWSIDDWSRDWSTNHAEITVDANDPALRSPVFSESPQDVAQRIEDWVASQSLWTLQAKSTQEGSSQERIVTLHLVRTTRLFRFADDIRVQLSSVDDSTRLTAQSQSRLGKGDLGQNPRNLKELLRGLQSADLGER